MLPSDRVILKPHDPAWADGFQAQKHRIAAALQGHLANPKEDIQHIGSTAIPHLVAKGTIDILVGLRDAAVLDDCVSLLTPLGYTRYPQGESSPQRRYLYRQEHTSWTHALHLIARNDPLWERLTRFRDILLARQELRDVYGRLKQVYAGQLGHDVAAYTRAKDAFILAVIG